MLYFEDRLATARGVRSLLASRARQAPGPSGSGFSTPDIGARAHDPADQREEELRPPDALRRRRGVDRPRRADRPARQERGGEVDLLQGPPRRRAPRLGRGPPRPEDVDWLPPAGDPPPEGGDGLREH